MFRNYSTLNQPSKAHNPKGLLPKKRLLRNSVNSISNFDEKKKAIMFRDSVDYGNTLKNYSMSVSNMIGKQSNFQPKIIRRKLPPLNKTPMNKQPLSIDFSTPTYQSSKIKLPSLSMTPKLSIKKNSLSAPIKGEETVVITRKELQKTLDIL